MSDDSYPIIEVQCSHCNGNGWYAGDIRACDPTEIECPYCDGKGWILESSNDFTYTPQPSEIETLRAKNERLRALLRDVLAVEQWEDYCGNLAQTSLIDAIRKAVQE